jgi:hypothetical protein
MAQTQVETQRSLRPEKTAYQSPGRLWHVSRNHLVGNPETGRAGLKRNSAWCQQGIQISLIEAELFARTATFKHRLRQFRLARL